MSVLLRRSKLLARLLSARVLSMVAQAVFLACIHQRWTYSQIGIYLGIYALFTLSCLVFSSGLEKQIIRLRAAGAEAGGADAQLVGRIATYGLLSSLAIAAAVFSLVYPRPLPPYFWALLAVGIAGMSLRVFTADVADHKAYVGVLDAQLNQAAALRVLLSAAVLLRADPMQVLSLELLGITAANLLICRRYRLAIRYAVGHVRGRFLAQVGMLFVSKLLQQLGVRFLLLLPAAQDEFHSAGLFGMLQRVAGLVTSIAEFIIGRLHVLHGLFDAQQTLGRSYRRRARFVVLSTALSVAVVAALTLALGLAEGEHLLAFLLVLATSPFQVWRTEMSNLITQRQAYWISPLSYAPATLLMALATWLPNPQPLQLSMLLLTNVVLNVATARLLLRRQDRA